MLQQYVIPSWIMHVFCEFVKTSIQCMDAAMLFTSNCDKQIFFEECKINQSQINTRKILWPGAILPISHAELSFLASSQSYSTMTLEVRDLGSHSWLNLLMIFLTNMDNDGKQSDVLVMDFSKTFDKVRHPLATCPQTKPLRHQR